MITATRFVFNVGSQYVIQTFVPANTAPVQHRNEFMLKYGSARIKDVSLPHDVLVEIATENELVSGQYIAKEWNGEVYLQLLNRP